MSREDEEQEIGSLNDEDDENDNDEDGDSQISSASRARNLTIGDDDEENDDEGKSRVGNPEDDEETSEEEDDDEEEPKLKYERLSSDLRPILAQDSASCIAVHSRFMVLGTHWGKLFMLDAMGNAMPDLEKTNKNLPSSTPLHSVLVSQISIDHSGEFVASCSLDGRIQIRGLISDEHNLNMNLNRAVRSMSIDPIFGRSGSGRRFLIGDDKVTMFEKIIFNRYKQTVLCQNEGNIDLIKWRGRFAAWTTDNGVKVFDVVQEKVISLVKANTNQPVDGNVPFRISWKDQFNLIVGMRDAVRVCVVKQRRPEEMRAKDLPEYKVEITHSFDFVEDLVCGIAPFGNLLVILTVQKEKDERGSALKPKIQVVEPLNNDYAEISTDLLSIRGFDKYRPKDYHLECLVDDKHYFIVSPKDVVLGKPRDPDDHLDWLLEHEKFSEALDFSENQKKLLKKHKVLDIGRSYLDYLLGEAQFKEAGELCVRIFGNNKDLWQDQVFKFARLKQLRTIAPYLPRSANFRLEPQIYEMTIYEFLNTDHEGFLRIVREWSPDLYNVSAIAKPLVEKLLLNPDDEILQRGLATLYSHQGKYDKSMAILLNLGHEDVFNLIREHNLFFDIQDKIHQLMELNKDEAVNLYLEHMDKLPPSLIVSNLEGKNLFYYLDALVCFKKEESKPYHGKIVGLYADFAKTKLLPFLKSSDHYPIAEALEICKERGYIEEQIFVLARMGNTKEALKLITEGLLDIQKAVEFCKEHDDPSLWEDLIDHSIDKPLFIHVLLHNIGTHVDPMILIQKIEEGQEIPGLRDSLVQIIQDYRLQVSLQQGCQRILVSDCFSLVQRQVKFLNRGISVDACVKCPVCGFGIVDEKRQTSAADLVVFRCHHAFHIDCLGDSNVCGLCSSGAFATRK